jgi:hypothetical protein
MYFLGSGLGQIIKPQSKTPTISQPRLVLADQLSEAAAPKQRKVVISRPRLVTDQVFSATVIWRLRVPFRRDFGVFRQEVAKAIGRHTIKNASPSDIKKADDWILKREENQQGLKAIHDDQLKRPKLKEFDIVELLVRFYFLRGKDKSVSDVDKIRESVESAQSYR